MDEVMAKIKEINARNNMLKKKYNNDEKFVRIQKRIQEENSSRSKPIISNNEMTLCENLYEMKCLIDSYVDLNPHIVQPSSEAKFKQDVMSNVSKKLFSLGIQAAIDDKKYLTNLISNEYIHQYETYSF